ncbi:Bromodomain-containing protein [Gautieria morchelliformis]|nr:Bromodomain-containing protein [Gautieria morchelliformis]
MHASPSSTPTENATTANGAAEIPGEQTPELAADADADAHMADVEAVEDIVDLAVNGVADAVNGDTAAHPPPSPPSVADDEHKPALLNGDVTFPDPAPDAAPDAAPPPVATSRSPRPPRPPAPLPTTASSPRPPSAPGVCPTRRRLFECSLSQSLANGHPPAPPTFSQQQYKFCLSTVRQLKKGKDAVPFLHPVDHIALGIPHYVNVIKHPMDLSTVERKVQSSNPAKPDPNLANPRYRNADEFVHDIKLIFSNTVTFNGPDHVVSLMGKRLEAQFDKAPKARRQEGAPAAPRPASPPPTRKPLPPRRASTSVPTIRRSDTEVQGRPKREIHPPPPKDLPYADAPRKSRKGKKKDDGTVEQLRYCGKILSDFTKQKKYWPTVGPFVQPVEWRTLNLPSYPKIVKKPMDMATMRTKLERGEYQNASRFWDDFRLMLRNCYAFNPAGSPVFKAGVQVQQWFDEKWQGLPPLREVSDDDDESDDDSDSEHAMAIAMMENQLATIKSGIDAIKKKKPKKDKRRDKYAPGSSKSAKSSLGKSAGKKKKLRTLPDEEVLSFEQKKDLSETIQNLDGPKLERVIQIIHEGVPEIRDSTEEIELDIDSLPASVLTKLYNYVLRPLRPSKRRSNNPGGGTAG